MLIKWDTWHSQVKQFWFIYTYQFKRSLMFHHTAILLGIIWNQNFSTLHVTFYSIGSKTIETMLLLFHSLIFNDANWYICIHNKYVRCNYIKDIETSTFIINVDEFRQRDVIRLRGNRGHNSGHDPNIWYHCDMLLLLN